jgi:hypothetical protein
MITGINNIPYFDMEKYLDMDTFEKLQPEIFRGFAESRELLKKAHG